MPEWALITAAAVAVLVSLGSVLTIARSGPIATRRYLQHLDERVREAQSVAEDTALRWKSYREGIDAILEEIEQTAARVERGRRKTAQAAARVARAEGGNGEAPPSREAERAQIRARARAAGAPV